MKEAEKILREVVGKDCIWEEMNNLTNTPIDFVVKAMEIYKNQALTIPFVSQQRELLLAYHRYLIDELSLDLNEIWVDEHLKANNCG